MEKSDAVRSMIHEMIQKADLSIPEEEKGKYEEIFVKIFCENQKPRDVLGFSSEMMEHIYAYGYRLFNLGNYKQASDVFTSLTVYDPYEPRYTLALGAAFHRQKNLREASQNYLRAGFMNPADPVPFFYLYDVYQSSGIVGDAQFCLEEAIRRMGDNPVFSKMKEKSLLYLESLKKEIEELKSRGELEEIKPEIDVEDLPTEYQQMIAEEGKVKEIKQ